jgi:uncharacterized membrane protein (DUF485 family)
MPESDRPPPQVPEPTSARHTRLGLVLFGLYLAIYVVYVALNAFWPQTLDALPLGGVNLGILYGLVLIVSAFVLALLYSWLCRPQGPPTGREKP